MGLFKYWIWKIYLRWRRLDDTYSIKIRDQVCHVMASLTKTFVSPEIVLNQKVNWIVHRNKASARHCSPLRDPWGIRPKLVPVSAGTRPAVRTPLQIFAYPVVLQYPSERLSGHVSSSFMSAHCSSAAASCCGADGLTIISSGTTASTALCKGRFFGTHGSPWGHSSVQCLPCPCSLFSSHICDDCGDRRDVLLPEIASYLVLQNDMDNHLFETTQSQNRSSQLTISKRITLKNQYI